LKRPCVNHQWVFTLSLRSSHRLRQRGVGRLWRIVLWWHITQTSGRRQIHRCIPHPASSSTIIKYNIGNCSLTSEPWLGEVAEPITPKWWTNSRVSCRVGFFVKPLSVYSRLVWIIIGSMGCVTLWTCLCYRPILELFFWFSGYFKDSRLRTVHCVVQFQRFHRLL